jgi:hypothetical protein
LEDFSVDGSSPDGAPSADRSVSADLAEADLMAQAPGTAQASAQKAAPAQTPALDLTPRLTVPIDPLTGEPIVVPESGAKARGRVRLLRKRNAGLALGLLLAAAAGASGAIVTADGSSARPSLTAASSAHATAGWTTVAASSSASSASGASITPAGSATPAPGPTQATPAAPETTGNAPLAVLTFNDLMLDSQAETGATARTFTFTTDGPGSVSAQVVNAAPLASSKICISVNGGPQDCATGATPGFTTAAPAGDHSLWVVTLIAMDAGSTPVVDLAFAWRTTNPSIALSHGRFQGSPNPDSLRGVTATFKTRAAGTVWVNAGWPPSSGRATVTLSDVSQAPGSPVDSAVYPSSTSISPAYSHAVKAGRTYRAQLQNAATDSGRTDLSMTIAFP